MSRFGLDKRFICVLRVSKVRAVHPKVHTWHVVDSAISNASVSGRGRLRSLSFPTRRAGVGGDAGVEPGQGNSEIGRQRLPTTPGEQR